MNNKVSPPQDPPRWEQRYVTNDLPWDSGVPDRHLSRVWEEFGSGATTALEIGCGTGTNALWLAGRGLDVVGVDLSPTAIAKAKAKAAAAEAGCRWLTLDFLSEPVREGPFDLIYDRGCFHSFIEKEERDDYALRVAALLQPGGVWHSLIGSTDGPPREGGPPRRSAAAVVVSVEPWFEMLELRSVFFDDDQHATARAWVLVARRREEAPESTPL